MHVCGADIYPIVPLKWLAQNCLSPECNPVRCSWCFYGWGNHQYAICCMSNTLYKSYSWWLREPDARSIVAFRIYSVRLLALVSGLSRCHLCHQHTKQKFFWQSLPDFPAPQAYEPFYHAYIQTVSVPQHRCLFSVTSECPPWCVHSFYGFHLAQGLP